MIDVYTAMTLDGDSPVPLYFQIQSCLMKAIDNGTLMPGNKLPSERELAAKLAVNRLTVRQAMSELVNEGFLTRKRGLGTFVARPKVEQGLSKLTSFTEDMRKRGLRPAARLIALEVQGADKKMAQSLRIGLGEAVIVIERLRLADEEPMALEISHLPAGRFPAFLTLRTEVSQGSLYDIVRDRYNVTLCAAVETLEAKVASAREAALLEMPSGMPVLLRERVTFDQNGIPVEYARSLYRSDRYKFMVEVGQ
ncbi:MAG: HTH-type transcriptional repressor YvoA [Firmicutes bacterium]|nr:HTH-type transcriptional repressor YvoA [Bacillota bacterium]